MKNFHVKFAFRKIIENLNVSIEQDLSKDLFERLISVYLRIRSHSFAKDIREKHKTAKLNMTKSLGKELKKISRYFRSIEYRCYAKYRNASIKRPGRLLNYLKAFIRGGV